VKPGLYPTAAPRSTESHGERAVYDAMARGLPKGWYAWHSLRIRVPRRRDAEADFVIADPARGILIIEVKGGLIEKYGDRQRCPRACDGDRNMVTGNAVHARAELLLFAGLSALGTAKPVTIFRATARPDRPRWP